ncbi:hypothetical protein I8752_12655 [Nostocaceae cyanobacterium CENA369]|uniref:Uncharacterized protein n=1 Tax=Dendronalium phyllosphericum CENA369 TaxID=1725256 RepID=A0A8J7I129_9NOST|nr:hypothetical protein [Dendronalium phyllosphericum]MBH8573856.1 hypothetical protein [Dendronalium phyllosphericum CENA369]
MPSTQSAKTASGLTKTATPSPQKRLQVGKAAQRSGSSALSTQHFAID